MLGVNKTLQKLLIYEVWHALNKFVVLFWHSSGLLMWCQ